MGNGLRFAIRGRTLDELWKEKGMYLQLRNMVQNGEEDRETKEKRMETLIDSEVLTNIEIFYQHYMNGDLEEFLQDRVSEHGARVMFADDIKRLRMQSKVCRILADLDVPKIGASKVLADLYHRLRLEVDASRKNNNGVFLFSVQFWKLYFELYFAYTADA